MALIERAENAISRHLDAGRSPSLLRENLNSVNWDEVAGRFLACGNCTMTCPTCFCVTFEDSSEITG
jgi:sulfhydrogenase subunit beta (sulfur reductase)